MHKNKHNLIPTHYYQRLRLFFRLALIGLRQPIKLISNINRSNLNKFKTSLHIESTGIIEDKIKRIINSGDETKYKYQPVTEKDVTCVSGLYLHQNIPQPLKTTISVIIPTKNAGDEFETSIAMIYNQKGISETEIIVIDSGSADDTLIIAAKYGATIIQIDPVKFTHSYSRNIGAENAKNDLLFFTVQDALLPTEYFFYELILSMEQYSVAGVTCAETPRYDSDLFYRLISSNHYKFLDVYNKNRILSMPEETDFISIRKNCQVSDIAFLVKKEIFLKYKYLLPYAEDLDLGIRLLKDNYTILFLGATKIIHSHNRLPYYFLRRAFVDSVFLKFRFDDFITPAILLDDLLIHITKSYLFLQHLIQEKVHSLILPCQVKDLKISILSYNKEDDPFQVISEENFRKYTDDDFSGFLQRVAHLHLNQRKENMPDNIILLSFFNFITMLYDHIEENYELVDQDIFEDYLSSLYKIFALVVGAHFAYCYLTDKENPAIKSFYEELTKNI